MPARPRSKLALGAALLAAVSACDSAAQRRELPSLDKFEGEITFLATGTFAKGAEEPASVILLVRQNQLRFDPPSLDPTATGTYLIDSPRKRFFVVSEVKKQAIQFDLTADRGAPAPLPAITKTGRRSSVLGFDCEDWSVQGPARKTTETVCVAEKPVSFFAVPVTAGMLASRGWLKAAFDGQHFPLRLVARDAAGVETGRLELSKIERKPLDPSLFAIPDSFQTIDVGALLLGKKAP